MYNVLVEKKFQTEKLSSLSLYTNLSFSFQVRNWSKLSYTNVYTNNEIWTKSLSRTYLNQPQHVIRIHTIHIYILNSFLVFSTENLLCIILTIHPSQSDYHEKDFLLKKVSKSLFIKCILEISSIYRTNFCEGNISMEGMDSLFSPIKRTDNTWSARYRNVMY